MPNSSKGLDDAELYRLAHRAADIVFEYIETDFRKAPKNNKPYMEDRRKEMANPFYHQTAQGLFLELYYGMPNRLWTPWGEWHFGGSGSGNHDLAVQKLIERFGAAIHHGFKSADTGDHGPVYALHRVDDVPLPEPIERENEAFASYEESRAAWERLAKNTRLP